MISEKDLLLDSPEAIKLAISKYDLQQGKKWAEGYHYGLMKSEDKVILSVTGINKENKFAKVGFDATKDKFSN